MKAFYQNSRSAYTLIEFIFILIIIALLAAIALPKLAATRDDAKLSTDISNMSACVNKAGSRYMATNINLAAGDSKACDSVICYTITYGTDSTYFKVETNPTAADYCSAVDEVGGHLAKTYEFRGTRVSY